MDVRKWLSRINVKWAVLVLTLLLVALTGLIVHSYLFAQNIKDPKSCFTTSMHKISLCSNNSHYTRYQQLPKILIQTLVISEDASFYTHEGLDWHELKESMETNWEEGRYVRGASTLTQQLAKNLYLSQSKTLTRKLKEFFIARRLEKSLSKAQILEKYFNVVEFGQNIYGIKQASSHYFAKSPSDLNMLESVYLISLLPSPTRLGRSFEKKELSKSNIWRMKVILKRLYATKRITDEVFVYTEMLLEEHPWPFYYFHPSYFIPPSQELNLEQELSEEMQDLEQDHQSRFEDDEEISPINNSDTSLDEEVSHEETVDFPPPSVDEGPEQIEEAPEAEPEDGQGEPEPGFDGEQQTPNSDEPPLNDEEYI